MFFLHLSVERDPVESGVLVGACLEAGQGSAAAGMQVCTHAVMKRTTRSDTRQLLQAVCANTAPADSDHTGCRAEAHLRPNVNDCGYI